MLPYLPLAAAAATKNQKIYAAVNGLAIIGSRVRLSRLRLLLLLTSRHELSPGAQREGGQKNQTTSDNKKNLQQPPPECRGFSGSSLTVMMAGDLHWLSLCHSSLELNLIWLGHKNLTDWLAIWLGVALLIPCLDVNCQGRAPSPYVECKYSCLHASEIMFSSSGVELSWSNTAPHVVARKGTSNGKRNGALLLIDIYLIRQSTYLPYFVGKYSI